MKETPVTCCERWSFQSGRYAGHASMLCRGCAQLGAESIQQGLLKAEQHAVLQRSLGLVFLLSSRLSSPLCTHAHMLGICPLQAQVVVCLVLLHTLPDRSTLCEGHHARS